MSSIFCELTQSVKSRVRLTLITHFAADFKPPVHHKRMSSTALAGTIAGSVCVLALFLGILHQKGCFGGKTTTDEGISIC